MNKENAFPNPHYRDGSGMSLRDYFAAKAMQGMIANPSYSANDWSKRDIAIQSYEMADAMLRARE